METTLGDRAHQAPYPAVNHQPDPIDVNINQEDDFDFEIGGDDGLDATGGYENEDGFRVDAIEETQDYVDQPIHHQAPELDPHTPLAENHNEDSGESGHQEFGVSPSGPDNLTATDQLTQDIHIDTENDAQKESQIDLSVADHEEAGENVETISGEIMYYEGQAGEFESLEDSLEDDPVQDHDLVNTATSVGFVQGEDGFQEGTHEAEDDHAETANNAVEDFQLVAETAQNEETPGDFEPEDHTETASAAIETGNGEAGDDYADANLLKNEANGEVGARSLDHSNWDEEADDHESSSTGPIVTVSYRGQEYSMFAQSPEDDPDTYFLDDVESIHRPLSNFLENLRGVIASEVEACYELRVKIDGLGLEFGESTTKNFLDQTTLAQIIEVNDKLSQNDGGSQHAELYIFLSLRSNPSQRFAELAKGAEEGNGLSYFEQYYEESPADASLLNDDEQDGILQDIGSDSASPEGPFGESQEAADGANSSDHAENDHDSVQVDDQHLSLDDAVSEILGVAVEVVENEAGEYTAEDPDLGESANDNPDVAEEVDDNSFGHMAINEPAVSNDNIFEDSMSVVEQVENEMGQDWDHDEEEADAQNGLDTTEAEQAFEVQTQLVIDNTEKEHGRSDDSAANMTNDEDYLDLGHDADNQTATTDANATEQLDIQHRTTPDSSATATLNGEENGQGDEAAATQNPIHPGDHTFDQTFDQTNQSEDDEIDWNHEDDDDIGVAYQNPTDLSPSSLSAKRSRQEDEGIDGLGEDSAAKRRRT